MPDQDDGDVYDVTVRTSHVGSCAVVAVSGEVDLYSAPTVREALEAHLLDERRLVLDLTDVTFLDSTGLGMLVSVHRKLPDGTDLLLAGATGRVARVFELTRLDRVFPMFATLDEAVR